MLLYSTSIIPDNKFSHRVKTLMGRLPQLDGKTVDNHFQIIGTLGDRVCVPLVREPAFDIPIVQLFPE